MNDKHKMTRRDWFRLRATHENQMLSEPTAAVEADVLRPIEHPPNHDGLDLSQLPPMREAFLSLEQVRVLFTDIEQLASNILLMQRSTSRPDRSQDSVAKVDTSTQLVLARDALLNGQVRKIQVRYSWQDSLWIDTLEAGDGNFRLVRIAHRSDAR